jgi:hypothetical protein
MWFLQNAVLAALKHVQFVLDEYAGMLAVIVWDLSRPQL